MFQRPGYLININASRRDRVGCSASATSRKSIIAEWGWSGRSVAHYEAQDVVQKFLSVNGEGPDSADAQGAVFTRRRHSASWTTTSPKG